MAITSTLTLDYLVTAGEVGNVITLDYTVVEERRQPGGWLPETIYLDEKGRPVDLKALRNAVVEEAREEPPKRRKAAVAVSQRVFDALEDRRAPLQADIEKMRHILADSKETLRALEAVIRRQEEDDDEAAVLLLAA